jgi:hypothetical protein
LIKEKQNFIDQKQNTKKIIKRSKTTSVDKSKPTIDYKVKIRILEKELNLTYQNYNYTKGKNETLKAELNELRKRSLKFNEDVRGVSKKLLMDESLYKQQREEIEKKLKVKDDAGLLNKIHENQKTLMTNNNLLIEQIKASDKDLNTKMARKKHLENEKKKLDEKEKKIDAKWENERRKFYEAYAVQIKHLESFDPGSKVLEVLDIDKLAEIETILNKMLHETNLNSIEELVQYFIKCTKEFKNFEDFIASVTTKVAELEKEVQELEFIINLCERNLEVKIETDYNETEAEHFEKLKEAAENFIHLQYHVIYDAYQNYCEEIHKFMLTLGSDSIADGSIQEKENEEKFNIISFVKSKLEEIQDRLNIAVTTMKEKSSGTSYGKNQIRSLNNNDLDFSEVDARYMQKSEKIKESVRKDFERHASIREKTINMKKIKSLIDPFMNEDKENK